MTQEQLDTVKTFLPSLTIKHLDPRPFSDVIEALEQAWIERDVNAMELEAAISERDEAIATMRVLIAEKEAIYTEAVLRQQLTTDQLNQRVRDIEAQHNKEIIVRYPY